MEHITNDTMRIQYANGYMDVRLGEFIEYATISKMKRLIKVIEMDDKGIDKKKDFQVWLKEQQTSLESRIENYKDDIGEAQNRLNKAKNFYEYQVYIRGEMSARIPEEHKQLLKDAYSAFKGAQTSERYLRSRCRKAEKLKEKISKMLTLFE